MVLIKYTIYPKIMEIDEIYRKIGNNIKKYRLCAGLTQEQLSEKINANQKFIGHVERVERYIGLKKIIKISEILNVPLKKFFDFD